MDGAGSRIRTRKGGCRISGVPRLTSAIKPSKSVGYRLLIDDQVETWFSREQGVTPGKVQTLNNRCNTRVQATDHSPKSMERLGGDPATEHP